MLLLFVIFVLLTFSQYSIATTISDDLETKYPGLTKAEARCPESPADNDYWYLAETYNKIPVCFGRRGLPANLQSFKDVEAACHEKHEDAFPARVYTGQNVAFLHQRSMASNAVIGAYFKNNLTIEETEVYGINSSDQYAVYLHGNRVYATNISTFSAHPRGKYILCETVAYPRVMDSYYNKRTQPQPNLTEYMCEGDGWDLQAPCNGTPFCYKQITQYKAPDRLLSYLTQINVCGMEEPNSFHASIHCQDEYSYIQFQYRGQTRLGLYLPGRGPWNKYDSWQNIDGTPADFVPWQQFEPNNCFAGDEKNVHMGNGLGFNDFNSYIGRPILCKKQAVKKQVSPDVKRYDTFEVNGKKCRKEPVTHWNHQCPTNSSLWQIVQSEAGVHCYALIDAPAPLSFDNFTHKLCHDLHPEAKLASFHYDLQFGFLYPENAYPDKIIVGLLPNNQTFIWADGTPVNKSFWAQTEPPVNSFNLVAKITHARAALPESPRCGHRIHNRPLFKTMKIEDVEADMKIACKIEAQPLLPCVSVPDADGMESLNNTVCPEGWTKQRFCDKVHCYKRVLVANGYQTFVQAIENDYCHTLDPESHLASIHCAEEHFFVQSYPAQTLIGLHIPTKFHNDTFDVKNFEWTDGTPVDFIGWNRFSNPETNDYRYAPLFPDTPKDERIPVKEGKSSKPVDSSFKMYFKAGVKRREEFGKAAATTPWIDAFAPHSRNHFIRSCIPDLDSFQTWLRDWSKLMDELAKSEAEPPKAKKQKRKSKRNESDDEDYEEERPFKEDLANTFILFGPTGSGKTSAAHVYGQKAGFNVVEVSASDLRSGPALKKRLSETIKSFAVKRAGGIASFFSPKATKNDDGEKGADSGVRKNMVLIDDADVVLSPDKYYWAQLIESCVESRIPIVLTVTNKAVFMKNFSKSDLYTHCFEHKVKDVVINHLQHWLSGYSGISFTKDFVKHVVEEKPEDIRHAVGQIEFLSGFESVPKKSSESALSPAMLADFDAFLGQLDATAQRSSSCQWPAGCRNSETFEPRLNSEKIQVYSYPEADDDITQDLRSMFNSRRPSCYTKFDKSDANLIRYNGKTSDEPPSPIEPAIMDCFYRDQTRFISRRAVAMDELPALGLINRAFKQRLASGISSRRVLHVFNDVNRTTGIAIDSRHELYKSIHGYSFPDFDPDSIDNPESDC